MLMYLIPLKTKYIALPANGDIINHHPRFDTMLPCDEQTDERTDRNTARSIAARCNSRFENCEIDNRRRSILLSSILKIVLAQWFYHGPYDALSDPSVGWQDGYAVKCPTDSTPSASRSQRLDSLGPEASGIKRAFPAPNLGDATEDKNIKCLP